MKKYYLYFFSLLLLFLGHQAQAADATFYLLPDNGAFVIGKPFTVKAMIDTVGNKINAAESTIKFDPKYIQITKISKDKSIFKLWTVEPAIDKSGNIKFGGGIPAGSYNGSNGLVFSIELKPLKTGTSSLSFATTSLILAANGEGANVAIQATSTNYYTFAKSTDIEKLKAEIKKLFGKIIIENKTIPNTSTTTVWNIKLNDGKFYPIRDYLQASTLIKSKGIKIASTDIADFEKSKFPTKSAGKIFIKDGNLNKVIYVNPTNLKSYDFSTASNTMANIMKVGTKPGGTVITTASWYIDIVDGKRYAIQEFNQALKMVRSIGIKINSKDIAKYEKTKFPSKSAGKIFIKDGDLKKVIYINPKDLKSYKFSTASEISSAIKNFGATVNVTILNTISNWRL